MQSSAARIRVRLELNKPALGPHFALTTGPLQFSSGNSKASAHHTTKGAG